MGSEINGDYIAGFVAAQRRKEMKPLAQQLFSDPSIVFRAMVEDLLKSKRIDGVDAIAASQFSDGRQSLDLAARAGDPGGSVQIIWGPGRPDHPGRPCRQPSGCFLQGASVHVLECSAHMPMMEKGTEVNDLIAAFSP